MNKNDRTDSMDWISSPKPGHLVHFYSHKSALIDSLEEYIGDGLLKGDNCAVIATKAHLKRLNDRLAKRPEIAQATREGQFVALDAVETLDSFMVDGLPDEGLFNKNVRCVIEKASRNGRPIRAYGEMVAVLWKTGNKPAVMELEKLWNNLAKEFSFALYCAYPDLHFIMDPDVKEEIRGHHNVDMPNFAF